MTAGPAAPDPGSPDGLEFVRVDIHDGLIGAILKNADEDLNGFNGTREQEAEHYVRWLESERERLIEIADNTPEPVTAREGAATAPGQAAYEPDPWRDDLKAEQVAQAAYEASLTVIAADLDGEPWAWESLPFKVKTSWHAASHAAIDAWQRQNAETVLATLEDIAAREAAVTAAAAAQPSQRRHEEFVSEITGDLLQALGDDADAEPEPGETAERRALRIAGYLKERIDELHSLVAEQSTPKRAAAAQPAPLPAISPCTCGHPLYQHGDSVTGVRGYCTLCIPGDCPAFQLAGGGAS